MARIFVERKDRCRQPGQQHRDTGNGIGSSPRPASILPRTQFLGARASIGGFDRALDVVRQLSRK